MGGEGGDGGPDGDRPWGAEVCGEVHPPRDHDDQVAEEESDQGREADGLREGGLREGEARSDPGEVLRREGAEGQLLSWEVCVCVPLSRVPGGAKTCHGAFAPGCGVFPQSVRAIGAPCPEPDGGHQWTSLYKRMLPKS